MDKMKILTLLMSGGSLPPLVPVITADASGITASAFTATITFPRSVTGFTIGDITDEQNGAAAAIVSNFAGSGAVYTCTVTPTEAGEVTLLVAAGVCTDAVGNENEASNTFSIQYLVSLVWLSLRDTATLFKDAAKTVPSTAVDDEILGVADKSGNNVGITTVANDGLIRKANAIGTMTGLYNDGTRYMRPPTAIVSASPYTAIVIAKMVNTTVTKNMFFGRLSASAGFVYQFSTTYTYYNNVGLNHGALYSIDLSLPHIWLLQYDGTNVRVRIDGSDVWVSALVGAYVPEISAFFTGRPGTYDAEGWFTEQIFMAGAVDDAILNGYRNALNSIYGEVFF